MSKKNNKGTRRRAHAFSLRREHDEAMKKQTKKEKKANSMEVDAGAKRKKGYKIKKGVRVLGIKIEDASSKKRALAALKARTASRKAEAAMETEA